MLSSTHALLRLGYIKHLYTQLNGQEIIFFVTIIYPTLSLDILSSHKWYPKLGHGLDDNLTH